MDVWSRIIEQSIISPYFSNMERSVSVGGKRREGGNEREREREREREEEEEEEEEQEREGKREKERERTTFIASAVCHFARTFQHHTDPPPQLIVKILPKIWQRMH